MYYIRSAAGDWLQPQSHWYHFHITFSNLESYAAHFTESEADEMLALPAMPAGCYKELIPT